MGALAFAGCGGGSGTAIDDDAGPGTEQDAGPGPGRADAGHDGGGRAMDAGRADAGARDGGTHDAAAFDAGARNDARAALDAGGGGPADAGLDAWVLDDAGADSATYMCPDPPASGTWSLITTAPTARPPISGPRLAVFSHTGSAQTFTVPDGVTSLDVKLWGAGGGSSGEGTAAGAGGFVRQAALTVTPGETLEIIVGGGGAANTGSSPGGFGGGGTVVNPSMWAWSGGGGGRSAIRRGALELLTAGGGGGSGYPGLADCGGIPTPPAGAGCANLYGIGGDGSWPGGGGGGGLQRGGAPGYGAWVSGGMDGAMGGPYQGADGLTGGLVTSGAGGGGYFGGGSGGWVVHRISGGGGGGSCYGPAGTVVEGGNRDLPGGTSDADWDGVAGHGGHPTAAMPNGAGRPGRVVIRW